MPGLVFHSIMQYDHPRHHHSRLENSNRLTIVIVRQLPAEGVRVSDRNGPVTPAIASPIAPSADDNHQNKQGFVKWLDSADPQRHQSNQMNDG